MVSLRRQHRGRAPSTADGNPSRDGADKAPSPTSAAAPDIPPEFSYATRPARFLYVNGRLLLRTVDDSPIAKFVIAALIWVNIADGSIDLVLELVDALGQ
jgi:hypothetical protein